MRKYFGDVSIMNLDKKALLSILLLSSISNANELYDSYKNSVEQCVASENQRPKVTAHDVKQLKPEDINNYLITIRNQRIQQCSNSSEMKALINEIASSKSVDIDTLSDRYLSIYLERQLNSFSEAQKEKLRDIDLALADKSLETDLVALWEKLKEQQ